MGLEHERQEPGAQDVSLLVKWGSLCPWPTGKTHSKHVAAHMQPSPDSGNTSDFKLECTHCLTIPRRLGGASSTLDYARSAQPAKGILDLTLGLSLIKARPPTRALFFWGISTISHFKLKIIKPLPRKSPLNHLLIFFSVAVIKENHLSEILSRTYQNLPSNQSISITITMFPGCCRY